MNLETWQIYLENVQGHDVIDQEALSAYASLVDQINRTVRDATRAFMEFEDEPAHFLRVLEECGR